MAREQIDIHELTLCEARSDQYQRVPPFCFIDNEDPISKQWRISSLPVWAVVKGAQISL